MVVDTTRGPVEVDPGGGEHPLPGQLPARPRILDGQGLRQLDPAAPLPHVVADVLRSRDRV